MQSAEIGHFQLIVGESEFNLIPSLRNMSKLASAKDLLKIYNEIHDPAYPVWIKSNRARDILLACSDSYDIHEHLNEFVCDTESQEMKLKSGEGKISLNDQLVVAAALIRHGVAGVNRPEYEGSKESASEEVTEFDVNKVVADAMVHFGLSESDALDLTMSKFSYLLAAKFPPTNKQSKPTLDQHAEAMKMLMEKNK